MIMTSTNASAFLPAHYEIPGALAALDREGLLLIPTDTVWSIVCDATDPVALERLRRLYQPTDQRPLEILFADLSMLKMHVDELHPRLETLLVYHTRPLSLLLDRGLGLPGRVLLSNGGLMGRVVHDPYSRGLIQALGRPLAAAPAALAGAPAPVHFGQVRSDVIQSVDYIARYRQHDKTPGQLSVLARMGEGEELEFLRD